MTLLTDLLKSVTSLYVGLENVTLETFLKSGTNISGVAVDTPLLPGAIIDVNKFVALVVAVSLL